MDSSQRSKSSGNVFWFMEDDWTTFAVLTSFSGGCVHNRSLTNPQNLQSGKLFFPPATGHVCRGENKDGFVFNSEAFPQGFL